MKTVCNLNHGINWQSNLQVFVDFFKFVILFLKQTVPLHNLSNKFSFNIHYLFMNSADLAIKAIIRPFCSEHIQPILL